jgi:hypothetical protein
VLSISADPKKTMQRIQEDFKLKDNKIAEPDVYLGATIAKMSLDNSEMCWTMSPEQYVKVAVTTVEEDLAKHGKRLPSKCVTPFSCNYAPSHPEINENRFQKCDWEEFYRDASQAIPENKPEPRGKSMSAHCFVDANHAGDTETRRSQTGILLFCNKAPTSKRQNSVEASTFGSEFTAMKNEVEMIEASRYKL